MIVGPQFAILLRANQNVDLLKIPLAYTTSERKMSKDGIPFIDQIALLCKFRCKVSFFY